MRSKLESRLIQSRLPRHIAIIMDGNGRWASRKGLDRIGGHQEGMKSVISVIKSAQDLGIKAVTLYAFSTQNWQRPEAEVLALMELLKHYLLKEGDRLVEMGTRLNPIGRLDELPPDVLEVLMNLKKRTRRCKKLILTLALSYGAREEIVDAVNSLVQGRCSPGDRVTEQDIDAHLYTADLPELDLLIRTSGEMRLSNFLLWQMAYAEIYVTATLWPDFRRRHLVRALLHYQERERRFGQTSEQLRKGPSR